MAASEARLFDTSARSDAVARWEERVTPATLPRPPAICGVVLCIRTPALSGTAENGGPRRTVADAIILAAHVGGPRCPLVVSSSDRLGSCARNSVTASGIRAEVRLTAALGIAVARAWMYYELSTGRRLHVKADDPEIRQAVGLVSRQASEKRIPSERLSRDATRRSRDGSESR